MSPLAHPYSEYLSETSRFLIFEDYGCSQSILVTRVSPITITIPPILLEIMAGVYGCLSIRAFYNRSKNTQINDFNFDSNRYLRLIFFSACDLLCGIPITLFYLYISITESVPFPGLKEVHYDFSYIV
jgi:pheromone a factor receptor